MERNDVRSCQDQGPARAGIVEHVRSNPSQTAGPMMAWDGSQRDDLSSRVEYIRSSFEAVSAHGISVGRPSETGRASEVRAVSKDSLGGEAVIVRSGHLIGAWVGRGIGYESQPKRPFLPLPPATWAPTGAVTIQSYSGHSSYGLWALLRQPVRNKRSIDRAL